MFKLALILLVAPAMIFADFIKLEACKKGGPLPQWLTIEGCDEKGCTIYNKEELTIAASLVAQHNATDLQITLEATLYGIKMELELPEEIANCCNSITEGCPVHTGTEVNIRGAFTVNSPISNIKPTIELAIRNENEEVVMCVKTAISLT